ncbi:MAG: hypothetical protein DI565_12815 [Ancylobacter novellus]|uniref:ATPase AAA-type core domain-containing protein n=1 Tax=Ancylobacter novellus TaxID=921 RepID=A0A2W5KHG6_ANCNO|nr:MAG: hypothetical protein DI565_12815 [Ancylobacter novellus]
MADTITELPVHLAERAAERHPLEALHEHCFDEGAYRQGTAGLAAACLNIVQTWAFGADNGGGVIPALGGLRESIFGGDVPDVGVLPLFRDQAAADGLPHRYRWHLLVACAAAGERLAMLEVSAGWGAIAVKLEALLADMLQLPLEGDALSERERTEIRIGGAVSRSVAWASLVDPVLGREQATGLTAKRTAVEKVAMRFSVNVFQALGQQSWSDGYAEGVRDAARKEAREGKKKAADEEVAGPAEPVIGDGLTSELEALFQRPGDGTVEAIRTRMLKTAVLVVKRSAVSEVVLKDLPGSLKSILGIHLSPKTAAALEHVREAMLHEFPHAGSVVDALMEGLADGQPLRLRPAVLVGEPGGGKSRLVRSFAERLHLPVATLDAGNCSDQAINGSPRRWHSSYPSLPLSMVASSQIPNPVIVVDELEKAGRSSAGSIHDSLLSLLEPLTARSWRDQFLDAEIDLSSVNWLFTANSLAGIPAPLRNRLRVLTLPRPAAEHLPALTASILRDIAHERHEDERFMPPLDGEELAALAAVWGESGSLRTLRRFVEGLLAARRHGVNPS